MTADGHKSPLPARGERVRERGSYWPQRKRLPLTPTLSPREGAGRGGRWRTPFRVATLALLTPILLFAAALLDTWARLAPLPMARAETVSVTVLDRNERLLRAFTTPDGRWRLPVTAADVDQRYLAMLKAFEDRRFEHHIGVDAIAVARASTQLVRHRRLVSGGSTLTMQTARLIAAEHGKNAHGKLVQMARALELERTHTKAEILDLYLRLAPFGGNVEGVRAASLAYFGKEPRRLSVGEAALLVALPQSPETRRPDRNVAAARRARDRVLDVAVRRGVITAADAARAKEESVPSVRRDFPRLAPHLAEAEVARRPDRTRHHLSIDRTLQQGLEAMARERARTLGSDISAAILVADHRSGQILAWVGSSDYLDDARLGAIDMVSAVRSPGSTLKPVIYGLGFDAGIIHPETLIEDRPARFGTYAPKNFDEEFHGTVTIRDALAQSLNIPAVKVLAEVGPGRLLGRFRRIGLDPVLPGKTEPTLAVALGGVGLKLSELAELYAALARGGDAVRLTATRDTGPLPLRSPSPATKPRPLLSPVAAWYVADILKEAPPPPHARGGRLAYKTGTSYGYRDAFAIGYDGQHVVAVWVGRADGASVPGMTGRTAAAPILFDAVERLGERRAALPTPPAGVIRATGADLPPPLRRFREGEGLEHESAFLEPPVSIAFPPDRSEIEVESTGDAVALKAEHGALPLTWLVDGSPIASEAHRREATFTPAGSGFSRITVIDAKGRVDRVTVRVR